MRSLLITGPILLAASPVHAQDSLPQFVFGGHHIGEVRPSPEPRTQCKRPPDGQRQIICARETLNGVSFDVGYIYDSENRLTSVGALVDSLGFEPLLQAFTKRYGQPRALRRGTGHDYAQWQFKEGRLHLTRTGALIVLRFTSAA